MGREKERGYGEKDSRRERGVWRVGHSRRERGGYEEKDSRREGGYEEIHSRREREGYREEDTAGEKEENESQGGFWELMILGLHAREGD